MTRFQLTVSLLLSMSLLLPPTFIEAAHTAKVSYCDKKGNYEVKVGKVEISPYPVARGLPATFSISATSDIPISGGKMAIDVSYFGVHIHSETHDLCQESSCPISAGDFIISHTQALPGFTPPGTYTLKMTMVDDNKHKLTCIGFDFSIGFGSSVADS